MRLWTEEQQNFCDLVSDFMKKEIKPHLEEWDAKNEFPHAAYQKAAALGLNALEFPEEYGGLGLDHHTLAAIYEQMGYYDSGLALTTVTTNLAWKPVLFGGDGRQKRLFCDRVLNGNGYASFAVTEPGGGSDVAGTRTRAVRDGDSYVLSGGKCFITNGGYADIFTVLASTDPGKGRRGLTCFLVERGLPGISIGKEENKCGIRTTNTVEVVFDGVRIPAANRLGEEGGGFGLIMRTLNLSRPFIGAIATGMAQRALDEAVAYAKERVVFGGPIAGNGAIQSMLADMDIKVETSRQMYTHVLELISRGLPYVREAAIAKCYCTDSLMQVSLDAVQVMGGYGFMRDYPVEKIMRDAKVFQIFEGTNQIQRVVISGQLLK